MTAERIRVSCPVASSVRSDELSVFILKRIGLALVTLWILSVIVFLAGQQLPGDPGRAILGTLADGRAASRELDHKLGVDRPLVTQYIDWVANLRRATWAPPTPTATDRTDHHEARWPHR